jgi:hypothetical protein
MLCRPQGWGRAVNRRDGGNRKRKDEVMEDAVVRLIKTSIKVMAERKWETAEGLVDEILDQGHLALHPEKKEEIVEFVKSL